MLIEHCGLFGIFQHPEAAKLTYFGLYAQQHRGQEAAGIAVWNGANLREARHLGLVHDVFNEKDLSERLSGTSSIGHVRHACRRKAEQSDIEPFIVRRNGLELGIAHNGALTNAHELRQELEQEGAIFHTQTDSELFAHLIVKKLCSMSLEDSILAACARAKGAYSLLMLANGQLIGIRDPYGMKPLALGRLGDSLVLASETCAFDLLEAEYIRSIEPGEMIVIKEGPVSTVHSYQISGEIPEACQARCIFELIYFARPDSSVYNQNVYLARKRMGYHLAEEEPVQADFVMPFPDSGIYCAVGYAQASKIPYEQALIRNHYVGRTFIQPTQDMRDFSVRVKLNPVRDMIKGKRIIIVDDSIVRGTTMRTRVKKLRELGALEVHCRISCPPIKFPCRFGIDFTTRGEIIAANHETDDIRRYLGLDSLHYLSLDGLLDSVEKTGYCLACFTGKDPQEKTSCPAVG